MPKLNSFHIFMILVLSVAVFGLIPAFAISVPDSPWQPTKNYAKIAVVANCGTNNDDDSDGICNNWESTTNPGLHISFADSGTTYVYNLSCTPGNTIANDPTGATVCPSPNQKDIYVELDFMTNHGPSPQAITDVVKAFDKMKIALHVIGGENAATNSGDMLVHYCFIHPAKATNTLSPITSSQCSFTGSTAPAQSLALLKKSFFGTSAERSGDLTSCPSGQLPSDATAAGPVQNANSYNCLTAKRQVFHYMVFANKLPITTGTGLDTSQSGWGEIPGNDAVVSLGSFTNGIGSIDEQESTMTHELGHNLGLHHGGDVNPTGTTEDDNNCKPNYLSVMSYTYQFRNTGDICRPLAFSNNVLNPSAGPLTESTLSDSNIDPTSVATYPSNNPNPPDDPNKTPACAQSGERKFVWSSATAVQNTTSSIIDWNMNGGDAGTYPLNINKFPITGCNTGTTSTLSGFNDTNYIYNGGASAALPLVFRTSALANFASSIVTSGGDADIGQGDVTQSEQSSNSSIPPPPVCTPDQLSQGYTDVNGVCTPPPRCPDGSIMPTNGQCPGPDGMWVAVAVGAATIGAVIAISMLVARRP